MSNETELWDAHRSRPWSLQDYETLHLAVLAMIRTHVPWSRGDVTMAAFNGDAYWAVLGALDRRAMIGSDDE